MDLRRNEDQPDRHRRQDWPFHLPDEWRVGPPRYDTLHFVTPLSCITLYVASPLSVKIAKRTEARLGCSGNHYMMPPSIAVTAHTITSYMVQSEQVPPSAGCQLRLLYRQKFSSGERDINLLFVVFIGTRVDRVGSVYGVTITSL